MRANLVAVVLAGFSGVACEYGCNIGDNHAINEFRARLHTGSPVLHAIIEAEQAQVPGIALEVSSFCDWDCKRGADPAGCQFGDIRVRREQSSDIRLTSAGNKSRFTTRESFSEALSARLQPPLPCGGFRLDFWRVGGYPNHDFIDVKIDAGGTITSVGDVQWAE
jgi:hypothetical protein